MNQNYRKKLSPDKRLFVTIDSFPDKKIPGQVGFISSVAEFTPQDGPDTGFKNKSGL